MIAIRILRRAVLACAVLLAPSAISAQASRSASARSRASARAAEPEAVFTLLPHRTRWAIDVQVGGKPFRFGFDTGGGLTLISPAVARAAGCTPWGRVTGFQMMGQRLDAPRCDSVSITIGANRFTPAVAPVIAQTDIEPNDKDLEGSLALDVFAGRALTLDLAAGRLTLESPASLAARVRTMTPLRVRVQREMGGRALSLFTPVATARGEMWMELDSGNGGTLLVSKPYAALLGLDSAATGSQRGGFTVMPGVRAESEMIFTPDMIVDGNLGMPFLRRWIITVDLATGRAWIAPAAPAASPPQAPRTDSARPIP
ncbi:MAG: hypothetical protein JWM27_2234 [Gemmatimonadetes bacterium]|nr:hypothetical protein [Gemmatimonadota bacterium]